MDESFKLEMITLASTTKEAGDAEAGMVFLEQDIPRVQGYLAQLTKALHSGKPISSELRTDLRKAMNGIETSMRMILGPDRSTEDSDSADVQEGVDKLIEDLLCDDDLSVNDHRELHGERKKYVISFHESAVRQYTQQVEVMLPSCLIHENYMRGKLDELLEEYPSLLIQSSECTHSDGHDSVIEIEEG